MSILDYLDLQNSKLWIEIICTPILTIAALLALKQLKLSKEIAQASATRDSLKLSSEQCSYYMNDLIPLQNKLDGVSKEFLGHLESIIEIEKKPDSISFKSNGKINFALKGKVCDLLFLEVFNAMEAFATYFVSGVANEKIAYRCVGSTYCSHMETYLRYLNIYGAGQNHYKNIIRLYFIWDARLQHEALMREKSSISEKLESLKVREIPTAGTDFS